jgi:hypothetical protein
MMRVGLFKAVHIKTPASQHRRLLLTSRKLLQRKIYDIENDLRGARCVISDSRLVWLAKSNSRTVSVSSLQIIHSLLPSSFRC